MLIREWERDPINSQISFEPEQMVMNGELQRMNMQMHVGMICGMLLA